jgi:hypothetical protein
MFKALLTVLSIVFVSSLFATDIYVNRYNSVDGVGSISNPYKYITSAINFAHSNPQANTIYIRGFGNSAYYENLNISGFFYPLTITKWSNYPTEIVIENQAGDYVSSVISIGNNQAPITLSKLTISRTNIQDPLWNGEGRGGGIRAENNSNGGLLIVDDCIIRNCKSINGGGIYVSNTIAEILNSKFYGNLGIQSDLGVTSIGAAISGLSANITIESTLFYDNAGSNDTHGTIYVSGGSLSVNNATIVQGGNNYSVYGSGTYINSIIGNPNHEPNNIYNNCCVYGTDLTSLPGSNNMITDPMFVDSANNDFSLIWNSTEKSPCIMAGYSQFGQTHFDRPDIGAIQYNAAPHAFHTYQFPPHSDRNGIKWLSFPTVDRLVVNPVAQDWAFDVFAPLQDPQKLYNIKFKFPGQDEQQIRIVDGHFDDANHQVLPIYGYKFTMYENLEEPISFPVAGLKPIVADNPINLFARTSEKNTLPNYHNWIGYFVDKTQTAEAAFGNAIENIFCIQTQNWFMCRDYQGQWVSIGDHNNGQAYTLSYGDMVDVMCYTDMVGDDAFHWFTNGTQMEPYEKEALAHFNYQEQTEYIPVYVDLEGTNMPKEIGVYLDNICKGGAVVKDKLVEVPAYLLEGIPEDKELEFRLYYDTKASDTIPQYTTMNIATGKYEDKSITPAENEQKTYYRVKINTNDSNVNPVPKVSMSTYPNPFSSNSNIEYYLPKDSEVSIDIMNVKGQKVNSIVSGFKTMGVHTVNWDGKDKNGKAVSNGIYFAKMKYQGKQISQKMIYMK